MQPDAEGQGVPQVGILHKIYSMRQLHLVHVDELPGVFCLSSELQVWASGKEDGEDGREVLERMERLRRRREARKRQRAEGERGSKAEGGEKGGR